MMENSSKKRAASEMDSGVIAPTTFPNMDQYTTMHKESLENPDFWAEQAMEYLSWFSPFTEVRKRGLQQLWGGLHL